MSDWGIHDGLRKLVVTHPIKKEELRDWILREYEFWDLILSTLEGDDYHHPPRLTYYFSKLMDYANSSEQEQIEKSIDLGRAILESYRNDIIHHDDPMAKSFSESVTNIESLRSALFSYNSAAYFADAAYEKLYKNRYQRLIEESDEKYEQMLSSLLKRADDVRQTLDEHKASAERHMQASVNNAGTNLDSILTEKEQILKDIAAKVSNNILANQPVKFWEEKKTRHKKRAIFFGSMASLLAIIITTTIGSILFESHKNTLELSNLRIPIPDHFSIALIVLSASFGIWALKILIKLALSNVNMEAEALERSTMIKTYVALSESEISNEIKILFHKNLLTTGNSKIEDDTSPDVLKAIELIFKRK